MSLSVFLNVDAIMSNGFHVRPAMIFQEKTKYSDSFELSSGERENKRMYVCIWLGMTVFRDGDELLSQCMR